MESLADRLDETRRSIDREWDELYDAFVDRLRAAGAASGSPKVGDAMPPFALPDSRGNFISLYDLIERGPLVLSFYRGSWCPYCRTEMTAWSEATPQLRELGASFAAVTGEVGGKAEAFRHDLHLDGEILCDIDHGLALELGLVVRVNDELRDAYLKFGLDFTRVYGSPAWFLPVPATYVVDAGGTIRFADADVDFRRRAEPAAVLQAVKAISRLP